MKSLEKANTFGSNGEKITLQGYFSGLSSIRESDRSRFVKEVAARCEVNIGTVYNWLYGRSLPQKESHYRILHEMTGISEDQLFNS